ncbi:uncharacterized protein I206_105875 [Kwoniella pini CBS 10737]|uniref:Uncharacterized protein n=1 Tax=Kwoniella pini CBS 10737 TaxID=1296096 RepID=A0A1B9I0L6_9TREE|nr:uncharacterized protein I206_04695 [Kwoniella pini CBS 10737]OCF49008.1 hypothetical protein I206_04695 [Kwoniella pini CBS 10737]
MTTYQPLPTSDIDSINQNQDRFSNSSNSNSIIQHETDPSYRPLRQSVQEEFNRPPPSIWKRLLLILALLIMAWLSIWLGKKGIKEKGPTIIYANRYSDEFKYRPAASPVITEYLSKNKIKIRGASLGGVGIEEKNIPLTNLQIKKQKEKKIQEAKNKAREKMGLRIKKRKSLKEKKKEEELKTLELEKRIKGL